LCTGQNKALVDILSCFLYVPPYELAAARTKRDILLNVLPKYRHNWTERLTTLFKLVPGAQRIMDMTTEDFDEYGNFVERSIGDNIYVILEALTNEELESYWAFRIAWTKWKTLRGC
jgi:hypothetical protein